MSEDATVPPPPAEPAPPGAPANPAPAGTAPLFPPPPPPPPARRRRVWPLLLTGFLVFGLTAALLVWAPWVTPPPGVPLGVRVVSPKATATTVSWAASAGGTAPDHYLVLRDGRQVGSVPASQRSFADQGLTPGSVHRYTVIALAGQLRSGSSAMVRAQTITPGPVSLSGLQATWTTVQLHWQPSPLGPVPSRYAIVYAGRVIATVPGNDHSFDAKGLDPGTIYQYQVVARWGTVQSTLSAPLTVQTLAAPLTGSVPVKVDTVAAPGGGATPVVGDHWTDDWLFTPQCAVTRCTLKADLGAYPGGGGHIIVMLHDSRGTYSGSASAVASTCGSIQITDTVTVSVSARGAAVRGAWPNWAGTETVSSPYTPDGDEYCPAQSWTYSLAGEPGGDAGPGGSAS